MDDQYHGFHDDSEHLRNEDLMSQLIDPTHPLYLSPASAAPPHFASTVDADFDPASQTAAGQGAGELGPWGKRFVYSWFALGAAYFGLIFIFGAH